jgi:putative sugar O-methyltransferase
MAGSFEPSGQWTHISDTLITKEVAADLAGFRSSTVNYRLALWDPRSNGVRYLKDLIYNLGEELSEANLVRLRRIRNREVGDPITVRCGGEDLCIDYLQTVYELEFIGGALDLAHGNVVEIGAGYGRTCHGILSNYDIDNYVIIDLPNTLELSRAYLRTVLDEEDFARITFVTNDDATAVPDLRYDLCININSFGEMTQVTVRNYLDLIAGRCRHFYTKNQVGKYLDKSLDDHAHGSAAVARALSTGPLREVIGIHDADAVRSQRSKFLDAYRPGAGWVSLADSRAKPWSFYWQALYRGPGA